MSLTLFHDQKIKHSDNDNICGVLLVDGIRSLLKDPLLGEADPNEADFTIRGHEHAISAL